MALRRGGLDDTPRRGRPSPTRNRVPVVLRSARRQGTSPHPANWNEFTPQIIRLRDDVWTSEPASPNAAAKRKPGRPASENSKAAVLARLIDTELCNLLADPKEGQDIRFHPEAQPIRAVGRARLRDGINQSGILPIPPDGAGRRQVADKNNDLVRDAVNLLKDKGKVAANAQWIGLVKAGWE